MRRTPTTRGSISTRRVRALGLLALLSLATVVALAGPSAFARLRPAAKTTAAGPRVRITSNRVVGLFPRVRKRLRLTLYNVDTRHTVVVRRIRVRPVGTTNRDCAASRRNLRIRQYGGPAVVIRPGGTRRLRVRLWMPATVANACQRALFRLRFTAETEVRGR